MRTSFEPGFLATEHLNIAPAEAMAIARPREMWVDRAQAGASSRAVQDGSSVGAFGVAHHENRKAGSRGIFPLRFSGIRRPRGGPFLSAKI